MKPFKPHRLLAKLLPPPSKEEVEQAAERARLYGQRERIEVVSNEIVAGHMEYLACKSARVSVKITTIKEPESLVEYIVRRNVPRHLSTLDRACIAVLAQGEYKKLGIERMREGGRIGGTLKRKGCGSNPRPFEGTRWSEAAAKMVGTTAGAVRHLANLQKNAPDVFVAVRARRITTLREARELARRVADPDDRARVIEHYETSGKTQPLVELMLEHGRESRRSLMALGTPRGTGYVLHTGPMAREATKIPDASVNLIHADVVYNDVAMAEEVARIATRVLVHGGILALVSGNGKIQEIVNRLCKHMTLLTIGSMVMPWSRRSIAGSRIRRVDALPVFICSKGPAPAHAIEHLAYVAGPLEDRVHEWQKPITATLALVKALVEAGDTVLDLCCGSGTTGVAAIQLGCRFIGVDIDPKAVKIAASRLSAAERETSNPPAPLPRHLRAMGTVRKAG